MKYKALGITGVAVIGSLAFADMTEAAEDNYTVKADALNIRQGTSTSTAVIGKAYRNEQLDVIGEQNGWYKVNYKGKIGYASSEYVVKSGVSVSSTDSYVVTTDTLNVRMGASTGTSVIGKVHRNQSLNVTGQENGWYKIDLNGKVGYVSAQYVTKRGGVETPSTPPPTADINETYVVTTNTLNVRKGANTSTAVIGKVYANQRVTVTGKQTGWLKINYNGQVGYVSAQYLSKGDGGNTGNNGNGTNVENPGSAAMNVAQMISYAKTLIGTPYVFGGTNPSTGLDCSGFIYDALNKSGKKISRTNVEGYWNDSNNFEVVSNPQAGDMIFFQDTYKPGPSHMGIMVNTSGDFIHASDSKGVTISNSSSSYYQSKFLGYKKIK